MATFNKKKYSSYNFQTAVHAIFILPLFEITISSFSKEQSSWSGVKSSIHDTHFTIYHFTTIYQSGGGWWWIFTKLRSGEVNIRHLPPTLWWMVFFKYKLKQWNNIAQKADFGLLQRLQYYRTQMPNELLRGEQQSIFRVWVANQSAPIHFF